MTKILVIDDHPVVLQGCRRVLEDAGIENITLASNLIDGFRAYRNDKPDVIIIDLAIKKGVLVGLTFIRRLRVHDKHTPILVLTMHEDPMIASQSLRLGANGYILKDTSSVDIVKALQAVRQGRPFLSHTVASAIALMETKGRSNPLSGMTLRELQTLELIAQGKQYAAIAEELHVSYKTIANTCSQIKAKLGVKSLPELMRIAIDHLPEMAGQRTK
ncbi:MAG: response regulator transcription factor [Hyphomicrobium denitrificans]|mgnify:FL=1|jgi:DNA-binding NarL/FixJ family response regulator|uniref:Two component transcriptional regulator, LuxR family n=1 Tax=Hyphomicrobium denitrificans (strain ATCC 51888 / DSM 1869 / NCIMB 11706 / TK 0415) TaxID=582899 RepID=D8JX02_HYPDA|nr:MULTISPECIES: response regulator transcription factor [Hyphomicrobium]MBN9280827.1 response regulator transcription factor [Hyphomicrobium denitrificans]ADJ23138.1 two component transcriptional regulator, LuxR family [Hyphomicrobium denitrificans ATCC 51888]MBN9291521.1 response regulator transcription factor [Hyphomicrobium denitrificans]MBN9353136.1 response regulator transcription factor [Hyphomicrobium denitrificans]CEJ85482.1 Two component transcriptional regulator, LuxR family [Hyphom